MKKLLLLLFIIPFICFAQDETPTLKRDKLIITNLIRQQLPELYRQNKSLEVINLITEDFIMASYNIGSEEVIIGKSELRKYLKDNDFKNLAPEYTIKTLRILDNKAFVSGIYKITDSKYKQSVSFIITLTKQQNTAWLISQVINVVY